jgi:MFS family permease
LAALGSLVFAVAPSIAWANAGRLLVGGSVAVAFVCMLKLASHWIAPRRFALAGGMALCCGIIGAVAAGIPLRLLVSAFGWRTVMLASGLATLVAAVFIWRLVRDDPSERGYRSYLPAGVHNDADRPGAIAGLIEVLRYRNTWLLLFLAGGIAGPVLTFAGLWGVPYLTTHHGLLTTQAAGVTSVLLIAWAVGGPFMGAMSDRIGRRKPLFIAGSILSALGWSAVIFMPHLPVAVLVALLVLIGFSSGCVIIGFAFAKESVPLFLAGTVSGVANMGVMIGGMVLQPVVGWMLDRHWAGTLHDGVRLYELSAFRYGFAPLLAWGVISVVLLLLTRETYCKQMH